eukprot:198640-Lingulodinium_polyedra.AAC.1
MHGTGVRALPPLQPRGAGACAWCRLPTASASPLRGFWTSGAVAEALGADDASHSRYGSAPCRRG